jgi:hypothetical protein
MRLIERLVRPEERVIEQLLQRCLAVNAEPSACLYGEYRRLLYIL